MPLSFENDDSGNFKVVSGKEKQFDSESFFEARCLGVEIYETGGKN